MIPDRSHKIPNWTARQVVQTTLFVVAVGFGFWLLFYYRLVVLALFAAIIFGTAIRPMVEWFARRGLSRGYSLGAAYSILLIVLLVILLIILPILIDQTLQFVVSLPDIYQELRTFLLNSRSLFLQNIGLHMPPVLRLIFNEPPMEEKPLDTVNNFINLSGNIFSGFMMVIAVFLLTSFWIMESDRVLRGVLLILPQRRRQSLLDIIHGIEDKMGAYVRWQLILISIIGSLALIAYMIIGLPNALVLALIAGIFEVVPIFGPALGAVPALLVAFSLGPSFVFGVLLSTILIQGFENYLLIPRFMGSFIGVNPIITLLALATFGSVLGLIGALLAIPLAAVIQLLLDAYLFSTDQNGQTELSGRDLHSALHYEIQDLIRDVRKQIRKKDIPSSEATDQIEDEIEALATQLKRYLDQHSREEV